MEFHGRASDLQLLSEHLNRATSSSPTKGQAIVLTGRRRVGKSRLVEEFCAQSKTPYVIFQATRGRNAAAEREDFLEAVAASPLPHADVVSGLTASDWNRALRTLDLAIPQDSPSIVVIDEVPWLVEQDVEFEGALQTAWDLSLSRKPVLLILIGSDISVMQALQSYGRPFFGRAATMHVRPLHCADVQSMTGLNAAEAIDATLITGGFPELVQTWQPQQSVREYLQQELTHPLSALLVAGELTLLAEFPQPSATRAVLEAIGSGERTFAAIASRAGGSEAMPSGTITPILSTLISKNIVQVDNPLSTTADSKNKRYRIVDSYLRFWLAFLRRGIPLVERGRSDVLLERVLSSWSVWRGRAVEPLVHESLQRILPDDRWPAVETVGGWWNRQNNPEVDVIGADTEPVAHAISFIGSIKWLENAPFGRQEYHALARSLPYIPGADEKTPTVAVSRSGVVPDLPLATLWGPEELVQAWGS